MSKALNVKSAITGTSRVHPDSLKPGFFAAFCDQDLKQIDATDWVPTGGHMHYQGGGGYEYIFGESFRAGVAS